MDLKKVGLATAAIIIIAGVIYTVLPASGIPGSTPCTRGRCARTTKGCMVLTGTCSGGSCLEALKSDAVCAAGWSRETLKGDTRQVWVCNDLCAWELVP